MTLSSPTMTHDEALAFLYGRIDYERAVVVPYGARDFKLDRMRELLRRLHNPELGMPIVHVAGTKGKGSTSAMIASILAAAGYRTGLFTSPHLQQVEERVRIDGQPCSQQEFTDLVRALQPVAEAMDRESPGSQHPAGPTYFELTTAMALLHFSNCGADAAVLEVGLGGRLDSTNVCQPRVCVITSISFDHTKLLGDTLAEIAREKAGIVKRGIPVVSGVREDEPRAVIRSVCREREASLAELGIDFDFRYHAPENAGAWNQPARLEFSGNKPLQGYSNLELALVGRHQAANAAVALAAISELHQQGWNIPEAAIRRGLANVVWPARVEIISRQPTVVLDGAHNLASIEALLTTLNESFSARRRVLVFASSRDKDVRGMLKLLLPEFDCVILTRYLKNPRSASPSELIRLASQLGATNCLCCDDPAAAWTAACGLASRDDLICITGSFFLAAEIREAMDNPA